MNSVELIDVDAETCPVVAGADQIMEAYSSYLTDESCSRHGVVSSIYFPENTAQVVDAVRRIRGNGGKIVVSGARTGITGGAVGIDGASIISLEKMVECLGGYRFQSGVRLDDIPKDGTSYYPVDPTEMSASLGGTVATDASGARTYFYGSTRKHITGLTVVLANGKIINIRRGEVFCSDGEFVLASSGGTRVVPIQSVRMPPVKNTAGFYLKNDMDLIDLFIGSEGTIGVITEVEIKLSPIPEERLFLVVYLHDEEQALDLVEKMKVDKNLHPLAIEYFDPQSIILLRDVGVGSAVPAEARCALYVELLLDHDVFEENLEALLKSCGIGMDSTWAGFEEKDLLEMKQFRHAVPETINSIIGRRKKDIPALHKIGTDTAVPDGKLREFLSYIRKVIENEGLHYVVFGHIGDNHLHVNMLPATIGELDKAKRIYVEIARKSVEFGGSVSSEHGIGRLKKQFLEIQFSEDELAAMKRVKDAMDPDGVLNPGVMF